MAMVGMVEGKRRRREIEGPCLTKRGAAGGGEDDGRAGGGAGEEKELDLGIVGAESSVFLLATACYVFF
jgi:hypothetical protein